MSKKHKKNNNKRKKKKIIFLVSFILIAVAVVSSLSLTVLFKTKHVVAKGSEFYTAEEIISAASITNEDNLFLLNEENLLKRIQNKLPYIETISLKRKLPDTVFITATDVKVFLQFKNQDNEVMCDTSYRIIPNNNGIENINLVIKSEFELDKSGEYILLDEVTSEYIENVIEILSKSTLKISLLDITDTENIKMFVNDRFEVDFGNKYDFSGKFSQLEAMVKNIDVEKTGRIDLSEWSKDNTRGYFVEAQLN